MLRDWERKFPGRVENIFNSLTRVHPSHLLDRNLHDFAAVEATNRTVPSAEEEEAEEESEDFGSFATIPADNIPVRMRTE